MWNRLTLYLSLLALPAAGAVFGAAGVTDRGFTDASGIYHSPKPNLAITMCWSGEKLQLPAPIDIHATVLAGPEGRQWIGRGDKCTIHYTNRAGWKYEAEAFCISVNARGQKCPVLPKVVGYRPNGVIAKEMTCSPDGSPDRWKVYDEKGRLAVEIVNRLEGLPGTPFIRDVRFYNLDGSIRNLAVNNPRQIAWWETLEAKGKEHQTLHYCQDQAPSAKR